MTIRTDSLPTDTPVLTAADFQRKADADIASCIYVGPLGPEHRLDILLFALKDLLNSGVAARLVLAGPGDSDHVADLLRLARLLGIEAGVNVVRDPDEFARGRMYRHGQYFLAASERESECKPMQEALRWGCIPIARPFAGAQRLLRSSPTLAKTGSYSAFFTTIELIVRATFGQAAAFENMHGRASRALAAGQLR